MSLNLNSPKQLLEALHKKDFYPELKGKPSTDKRALEPLKEHQLIKNILKYNELKTLLDSFVYPYLENNTNTAHAFFNQCGTRTGRPACSKPNLLQIPKKGENGKLVRRMFVPRDGMLLGDADYQAIEPRVLGHLSKDPVLCQMFNDGTDFHTYTAERLQISRDRAKILNLSVGYRSTFKSVMQQLGCDKNEAQMQINQWWALFPGLRRWQEQIIFTSKRSGFCETIFGRRIRVDGLSDYNQWKREAAERQLINNITQGSAAEIMKMGMIKVTENKGFSSSFGLLIQIYDALIYETANIEEDSQLVKECMENACKLEIPLVVEVKTGPTWADCK